MPTEKEILKRIEQGNLLFPPLSIRMIQCEPLAGERWQADACVEVAWGTKKARFAVEIQSMSTPKAFQVAINQLKSLSLDDFGLMLIMPFLNDKQLQVLEREGISGIDLCGNGVVVVPGTFAIYRSGEKNRFPSSAPIKNIYRKNSSMVGRVFLSRTDFSAVNDIRDEINKRGLLVNRWDKKPMSISTVSKALKTLEEDLIIERNNVIRLLQGDKLLDKLSRNYSPVFSGEKVLIKLPVVKESLPQTLWRISQETKVPVMAAGTSSVSQYAVMPRGEMLSVYCPFSEGIIEAIQGDRSARFPNLEIIETEDETVYFDAREDQGFRWASPVQVYLELMQGDKRDQETGEQVRTLILKNLSRE